MQPEHPSRRCSPWRTECLHSLSLDRVAEGVSEDFHFAFRPPAICFPSHPLATSQCARYRSKPRPHAYNKSNLTRVSAFLPDQRGGLAKTPIERDADIGGKLASDFIAQPNPEFEVVETRAGREFLDSLYGGVGFKAGLEDQSLRHEHVFRQ